MANFKEAGRLLNQELEKLRRYFEIELKPATEQKAIGALRKASQRLAELAQKLEDRAAGRKQ